MTKTRLEAFSDGVLAIIITILVLELEVPHGETFAVLAPLLPAFLAYVPSFVYVGIYWNNHHHMLHAATRVTVPRTFAPARIAPQSWKINARVGVGLTCL